MSKKQPWPTKAAMQQVYEKGLWGTNDSKFYSGDGSHHPDLVAPYVAIIRSFLAGHKELLTVCDLGCGDFNIGKQLLQNADNYIAVDIVPELIVFNRNRFEHPKLEFQCLDLAKDTLPKGDLAILRQVLQHLSNAEIQQILPKLKQYQYVILTEHLPDGDFEPNKDIISGQGTRLKQQSGVVVSSHPFNLKPLKETRLLSLKPKNHHGRIVTTLYTMF